MSRNPVKTQRLSGRRKKTRGCGRTGLTVLIVIEGSEQTGGSIRVGAGLPKERMNDVRKEDRLFIDRKKRGTMKKRQEARETGRRGEGKSTELRLSLIHISPGRERKIDFLSSGERTGKRPNRRTCSSGLRTTMWNSGKIVEWFWNSQAKRVKLP